MAKQTKSHYETLGVKSDASPDEIKRTYRKRAENAHPDKGGDHAEMAEINHAYAVLGDPERRLLYDQTGKDKQSSVDEQVRNLLLQAFASALGQDSPTILSDARKVVESAKSSTDAQKKQVKAAIKKLKARRGKIKTKGHENVFHMIVDQEIANMEKGIVSMDEGLNVCDLAMKKLDEYETSEKAPEPIVFMWTSGASSSTG